VNVRSSPIGIFDSGLGGLSIVREVRQRLPAEQIVYLADSAYCPYGTKPLEVIRSRTAVMTSSLITRGCKLVIVACNTACAAALDEVRGSAPVPVIGLEPAVKPAVALSKRGRIGVLATPRTAQSPRLQALIARVRGDAQIFVAAAPGLVEFVERGEVTGPAVEAAVRELTQPLLAQGIDVLVLGCTHFPFLRRAIEQAIGPGVLVVDSGEAIARRAKSVLEERSLLNLGGRGGLELTTSGDLSGVARLAEVLLGAPGGLAATVG
jgi:glutamate racemase